MSTNMNDYTSLTEGMEVFDVAGEKVGKIKEVTEQAILVEKGFFFPKDYLVSISYVEGINNDNQVFLTVPKDQLTEGFLDDNVYTDPARSGTSDYTNQGLTGSPGYADSNLSGSSTYTDPNRASANTTDSTFGSGTGSASEQAYRGSEAINPNDTLATDAETTRIPVYEEQLTPVKRSVDRGAVRVQKDVVTEERTIDVPVNVEKVRVSRVDTNEPVEAGEDVLRSETIDVPIQGEEIELQKSVRQVGEVVVEKEAAQQQRAVEGKVRREEVKIDDNTLTEGSLEEGRGSF